ncbi:MAG: M56 family metallopeptidase [Lachnospiraceae bacterium]|nr:M56 family metallopeptidase [Lachnospiraceae bacterium]
MILVLCAVALNRLPKRTFLILWEIAILRLLVPFSIPSVTSIYALLGRAEVVKTVAETPVGNAVVFVQGQPRDAVAVSAAQGQLSAAAETVGAAVPAAGGLSFSISVWTLIWLAGLLLCAAYFVIAWLRCRLEFSTSLPVQNEFAAKWIAERWPERAVSVRESDRITTPLTYGIVRPMILMPAATDWTDEEQLEYIFSHEYIHIRHFDTAKKLVCVLALCVHWFNPLVWVLYLLFNRDIELACDEGVVRRFGQASRREYSLMLLHMESEKGGVFPLCNHFSKNAVEERITAIMKTRKLTVGIIVASIVIVLVVIALFATSAGKPEEQAETMAIDSGLELRVDLNGDGASTASMEQGTELDDAENSLSADSPITVAGLEVSISHSETDSLWQVVVEDDETGQETKIMELNDDIDITLEDMGELMGMPVFMVQYTYADGYCTDRHYFGIWNSECVNLGYGGGYEDSADYFLDVDGDGVTELICNSLYSDGGCSATIYRWDGERVWYGSCGDLRTGESDASLSSSYAAWTSWYLPRENVVVVTYEKDGISQTEKCEIDISRITMYEYVHRYSVKNLENSDQAFGKMLWDIYLSGVLPDGTQLAYINMEAAEASSFAIADVDGDGAEELLLDWEDSTMAGMEKLIFGYDGDEIYVEFAAFPSLRIYDNGIIEADWSHNQGFSGRFWPYHVYLYDAETDAYQFSCGVEAWDREVSQENGLGTFPEDIDEDGDGLVYCITTDEVDPYADITWIDGGAYEGWHDSCVGDAKELSFSWRQLTEENIAALGYPKPDVEIAEPVG